jgi:hypothetical protein
LPHAQPISFFSILSPAQYLVIITLCPHNVFVCFYLSENKQ